MSKDTTEEKPSLLTALAKQWGVEELDGNKLYETLKATAFKPVKKGDSFIPVTQEQFIALLIVAKNYNLNPFLKEIYAFPAKDGSIVPVVSVDGWANIINSDAQMGGLEYNYAPPPYIKMPNAKACPEWIECVITRKDRDKPIIIREYLDECYQSTTYASPWQTHTKRFLRHKATIQCARMAFGFAGIYDPDEAENIIKDVTPIGSTASTSAKLQGLIADNKVINQNLNSTEMFNPETGEITDSQVPTNQPEKEEPLQKELL